MLLDHAVVKNLEGEQFYDKYAIAATVFGVSFKGATCSLIESQVLKSCESCNLRYICTGIDELVEDYTNKTTVVTNSFNFGK
jgi:hypothetical protein